ncbi:MAG: DNA recombinase [Oscillibacter sp.]|nr:DNA recombinase [Oscillibacter sp.]
MPYISVDPEANQKQLQKKLKELAEDISSELAILDEEQSKVLLSDFVSDLFLATAERKRKEERRQRQAEGIAAAKARGVRFGRTGKALPDNFDEIHHAWRGGQMNLQQAADACGMPQGTFYGIATRRERAENRAI